VRLLFDHIRDRSVEGVEGVEGEGDLTIIKKDNSTRFTES